MVEAIPPYVTDPAQIEIMKTLVPISQKKSFAKRKFQLVRKQGGTTAMILSNLT